MKKEIFRNFPMSGENELTSLKLVSGKIRGRE
jgi:hypothetical protein